MPGTLATKGGVAEANEHLRQLYARIDELETQLQAQIIYREQLTSLQNENIELKEMLHRLQFQNQELVNYVRERTNEVAKLQSENKQLVEIVSDLANQRKAVDEWISLTNRAAHTVNQLSSFKSSKQKASNRAYNHVQNHTVQPTQSESSVQPVSKNKIAEIPPRNIYTEELGQSAMQANNSSLVYVEMHQPNGTEKP
ncbi:uncharacterized protein LOC142342336 [Convolutriloba macropyga]|uniref:uncharacterized protein LOC142342336 n=1 Tax=Convolutriloba macropyga TaxID=536237 RepID=UPI003F51D1C4